MGYAASQDFAGFNQTKSARNEGSLRADGCSPHDRRRKRGLGWVGSGPWANTHSVTKIKRAANINAQITMMANNPNSTPRVSVSSIDHGRVRVTIIKIIMVSTTNEQNFQ